MTHRVLVTAVGGNVGQGVVKALRAGARQYTIIGTDMEPASAGFAMVDRARVTPPAADPSFIAGLIALIQAERIEAVFVCSPPELPHFAAGRAAIEAATGARVLINPARVLEIGGDKLATARFLETHGFPFPETAAADDAQAVDALISRWGFPVIGKPRRGASSINVFRLESRAAIDAARTLVPGLVIQRALPVDGNEFTAGVVGSAAARTFASIALRRDLIQGTTYRTELAESADVTSAIVAMAQALGVEGPCNFQFSVVDGEVLVFEINPRFSGTSGIRYLYGFNDPELVLEQTCLGLPLVQPELKPGVVLRYWNELYLPGQRSAVVAADASGGRAVEFPAPHDRSRGGS
jgi:carbamoyl-phosphate synthase large subunit